MQWERKKDNLSKWWHIQKPIGYKTQKGARHAGSQANEAGQIPQGSTGYGMEKWTARVRQEMRND